MDISDRAPQVQLDPVDLQFQKLLHEIDIIYESLPKGDRIRIERWVKKLCEASSHPTFKKNRNNYAKLLLFMIQRQKLEAPFDKIPPESIPMLPKWQLAVCERYAAPPPRPIPYPPSSSSSSSTPSASVVVPSSSSVSLSRNAAPSSSSSSLASVAVAAASPAIQSPSQADFEAEKRRSASLEKELADYALGVQQALSDMRNELIAERELRLSLQRQLQEQTYIISELRDLLSKLSGSSIIQSAASMPITLPPLTFHASSSSPSISSSIQTPSESSSASLSQPLPLPSSISSSSSESIISTSRPVGASLLRSSLASRHQSYAQPAAPEKEPEQKARQQYPEVLEIQKEAQIEERYQQQEPQQPQQAAYAEDDNSISNNDEDDDDDDDFGVDDDGVDYLDVLLPTARRAPASASSFAPGTLAAAAAASPSPFVSSSVSAPSPRASLSSLPPLSASSAYAAPSAPITSSSAAAGHSALAAVLAGGSSSLGSSSVNALKSHSVIRHAADVNKSSDSDDDFLNYIENFTLETAKLTSSLRN